MITNAQKWFMVIGFIEDVVKHVAYQVTIQKESGKQLQEFQVDCTDVTTTKV